jgi:hypothetical protein
MAATIYLTLSLLFFARILTHHLFDYYVGRDTDPSVYIWCLEWWSYVVSHHVHPFLTKLVWAPYGTNLTWFTCLPLLGILALPLTNTIGGLATFNLLCLVALPLSATAAFVLCRKFTKSFSAALLGGLVFGFSPYMVGQLLGHLVLVMVFPIPIAVGLVIRRFEGALKRGWFVILLGLLLAAQFLLEIETFALMLFVAGCAGLIALRATAAEVRSRLFVLCGEMVAAGTLTGLLVSPYIYFFFGPGHPTRPLWSSSMYSIDLLNFIIPTPANAVGANSLLQGISKTFPGNIFEQGACLGIPLIAIAIAWGKRHRGEALARILLGSLILICVFSLGPFLHIAGRQVWLMPWLLLEKLPILESTLPVRLTVFAFLSLAIVFTLWLSDPLTSVPEKAIGVIATLIMLMPNPTASFWAGPQSVPAFFRDGISRRMLTSDDIVLPLPWGQKGLCMLWQAESGMSYRMATGWTGFQPIAVRRWPVLNQLSGSYDLPEQELQLKAFLANLGITAIVIDAANARAPQWQQALSCLNIVPQEIGGVLLYRIPSGSLSAYRGMDALALERRADRGRFEALLSATDRYLAQGGDPGKLNVPTLESAGLFPSGWTFDPQPDAYRDIWSGRIEGKIAVGVAGTASAIRPIIESFGADAAKVYFPYPRRWSMNGEPENFLNSLFEPSIWGSTSGESIQLMVMEFDPPHLHDLAARVASQAALSLATVPREASH